MLKDFFTIIYNNMTEAVNLTQKKNNPEKDLSFRIICAGNPKVGKTSLIRKAIHNTFEEEYLPTIGLDFSPFSMKVNVKDIKLLIYDYSGQEKYRSIISSCYKGSSLIILFYSIDNKESFQNLEFWLQEVKTNIGDHIKKVLVGNKIDLEGDRQVSKEEGEKFKETHHFDLFMETSVKTGVNVENVLIEAGKMLYNDFIHNSTGGGNNEENKNGKNNPSQKKTDELISKIKSLELNLKKKMMRIIVY